MDIDNKLGNVDQNGGDINQNDAEKDKSGEGNGSGEQKEEAAWFSISILPIGLINIGTSPYWRILASIGDICNICRSSWRPFKKLT